MNHYLRTTFLSSFLVLVCIAMNAQLISPFTSIYQTNQRGGIVFLSNASLGCSGNPAIATGTCLSGSLETPLLGTTRNDDYSSVYIDIDSDVSTFMSSSDRLDLPLCSQITKAFLFWGASGTATAGVNQVKLKVNNGSYQTVVATSSLSNTTGINSYHCYADVTSLIANAGITGSITVADIASSQVGTTNSFGSWNLVVVYKNDIMNVRQLTVFNGLAHLSLLTPTVNIPLTGFLTPTLGPVSFEIGAYSHDGDRGQGLDNILFNGNLAFMPLVDLTANPLNDVMNSTVSNNGIQNLFRNPLLGNTMGSDADIYAPVNLLNAILANSATSATVQLVATTDDYLTQALTSSIDTYEPELRAKIVAKDVNGGTLNPGEIMQYRVTGYNIGSDFSLNTFIVDTLDKNLNYIPNSTSIVFGQNTGSKTDAVGDDQVDYNPATRILKIRIGAGAGALNGGSVTPFPTGIDSTVVTYSVAVSQSCLKLSCNNLVHARAYISGTGSVSTHTITNMSTPGTSDVLGCSILGTTTSTVNTGICSAPTATSSSPACSGGNLTLNASNDPEAAYLWAGPNSYTSSLMNPTLTAITTSISGTYAVTLSIPNSTCAAIATTSVTVINCTATAVNDFSNTVINTIVSGNAAANDLNALPNGTFAITSQPANGTISINSSTGVYSFTPAVGFTGITTATYQLCNSLPIICSQASITFTVYPNLIANADLINTTPLTPTTGSLLANDNGITAGANYTVTITQPASTVGTITINPSTGQYTFVPNILFTGNAQTTYTVCNTSVSPQQCSSNTITIIVSNLPIAVDDHTATVINTSVNGNAAINDSGTLLGAFTFGNVSAGTGTLTGNLLTGLYSFTPAAGFTGTTSATYTLCNLSSPPCSTAMITFTVFPVLVAADDFILTTPSVTATGSLLANDAGIDASANYTVSITQLPAATGTLLINSTTGSYTFIPGSSFTGSTQTTYTVCNTSVNPQQCSSATITVFMSTNPIAVNDGVNTVVNMPVSGNAGSNDSGTLGGTFTFGSFTTGTGTLTGNSLTGQFTFTPAPGFTGTTSATYTLCNLSSPPCSTATITFTVYENLQAVNDVILTAPSATASGSLLTNDLGISSSAVYSVSITQLSASTGTLLINSASGSYTFIPGASFTGSAQTTYTVCNTSVSPQQCSTATITIYVGNFALAVNDNTLTLMGIPVSGNVSNNDINFTSGAFTFNGPSPVTGTLVGNPATGQYTFTPFSGFSGVTYASYTLCPPNSAPCSTALITFTVYPNIIAKPDLILTSANTPVQGNIMTNDVGMFQGGSYSVAVSPVSPLIGVLSVSTTGQYTFTPAVAYTGSSTTTYTLYHYNGTVQLQSSATTITITVTKGATLVGIAKSIKEVTYNSNGTIDLTYKVVVKNYSTKTLTNVAVTDDLSATFPAPTTFSVIGQPTLLTTGSQLQLNNSYSGIGNSMNLTSAGIGSLSPGRTDTILFKVSFDPHHVQYAYNNSASISAAHPDSTFTDLSVTGLNPDPDNNGNPGDNTSPTTFTYNLVRIGIAKYTGRSSSTGNGCYTATFKFTVKNYGTSPIYNIQVTDNLNNTFGSTSYSVDPNITTANGFLVPNTSYNGSLNTNLVLSSSTLGVGQTDTLYLKVNYCSGNAISFSNTAVAYGNGLPNGGFVGFDLSTSGLDPDPDGNNDPSEETITLFTSGDNFEIPQGFSPNGDGINDMFEIKGIDAYPGMKVDIMNRWGNLVYSKDNYDNSWDGKSSEGVRYGSSDLPEGTYFYIIDLGNDQKPVKGYIYLNRAVR